MSDVAGFGAACQGWSSHVTAASSRLADPRSGKARLVKSRQSRLGSARRGEVSPGPPSQGMSRLPRCGASRSGWFWYDSVGHLTAVMVAQGKSRCATAEHDTAVMSWLGTVSSGTSWPGAACQLTAVTASFVGFRTGKGRHGRARHRTAVAARRGALRLGLVGHVTAAPSRPATASHVMACHGTAVASGHGTAGLVPVTLGWVRQLTAGMAA